LPLPPQQNKFFPGLILHITFLKAKSFNDWRTSSSKYMMHISFASGQMMKVCLTHICGVLHFVHIQTKIYKHLRDGTKERGQKSV